MGLSSGLPDNPAGAGFKPAGFVTAELPAADPGDLGWDVALLDDFVSWAELAGTKQLLVVDRGQIVAERYWAGAHEHSPTDVFSVQKSVTSLVVGALVGKGLLDLDRPASTWLGVGWTSAGPEREERITLRHLLAMTSGLYDDFSYEVDPGTSWYYNNNAYHQVRKLVAEAAGRPATEVFDELLFSKIGMEETDWRERPSVTDPTGTPLSGLFSTGRDLARFGLLALAGGVIADGGGGSVDVIGNRAYVAESMRAAQDLNPSYGLLWWIQDGERAIVPDMDHVTSPLKSFGSRAVGKGLSPSAPPGTAGAMGAGDQRLFVVPGHDVVVVRIGRPVDRPTAAASNIDEAIWKRLAPALPR